MEMLDELVRDIDASSGKKREKAVGVLLTLIWDQDVLSPEAPEAVPHLLRWLQSLSPKAQRDVLDTLAQMAVPRGALLEWPDVEVQRATTDAVRAALPEDAVLHGWLADDPTWLDEQVAGGDSEAVLARGILAWRRGEDWTPPASRSAVGKAVSACVTALLHPEDGDIPALLEVVGNAKLGATKLRFEDGDLRLVAAHVLIKVAEHRPEALDALARVPLEAVGAVLRATVVRRPPAQGGWNTDAWRSDYWPDDAFTLRTEVPDAARRVLEGLATRDDVWTDQRICALLRRDGIPCRPGPLRAWLDGEVPALEVPDEPLELAIHLATEGEGEPHDRFAHWTRLLHEAPVDQLAAFVSGGVPERFSWRALVPVRLTYLTSIAAVVLAMRSEERHWALMLEAGEFVEALVPQIQALLAQAEPDVRRRFVWGLSPHADGLPEERGRALEDAEDWLHRPYRLYLDAYPDPAQVAGELLQADPDDLEDADEDAAERLMARLDDDLAARLRAHLEEAWSG